MTFPIDHLLLLGGAVIVVTGVALGFIFKPPRTKLSQRQLRRIERESDAWRQAEWAERIDG